ncbi:MAG: phage portal protein [Rhizobiaceae bacterium]
MGILDRLFAGSVRGDTTPNVPRDPTDDFWYSATGRGAPAAGIPVTLDAALTVPIIADCLQVLSQTVGGLPWGMFERAGDGSKTARDNHPLSLVLSDPNPETTATEFFAQMAFDLASVGNSFYEIRSGRLGPITELWRLDFSRVSVERLSDGSRRWLYLQENGQTRRFVEGEIWHVRATPLRNDGLLGFSRIDAGREQISAALAMRQYAHRFFANDATPPFVIKMKKRFADDESRENYLAALKRWWSGKRQHGPGLLEHEADIQQVGVNNEQAQFLETRKEVAYELAQLWRMPPHKVGLLERATNNNIEHQGLEFVTDCLMPWLDLIEESVRKSLIINTQRFFFEFNVAGLLRGDLKARYEAYAQGRQWGWLSVNDIRKLENMNPIAGGNAYLTPLNMVPSTGSQPPQEQKAEAEILGPHGRPISRIVNGNIVRLEDFRNAA